VLLDYRPALRGRTGAGEFTHELSAALLARSAVDAARPVELTIFSSSWKDRLWTTPELRGAGCIDRRIPVTLLNLLWHRLEWPAADRLARRQFDVVHSSHPLLMPAVDAAQVITIHDLDFLSHPERTRAEVRRDYASLVRSHASRAHAVVVPSRFTAGEVGRQLAVPPDRIAVCSPGTPDWHPRSRPPREGYLLFFGTLEPRKNVGVLLDAYARLLESRPSPPPLLLAGHAPPEAADWLSRISTRPFRGRVTHIGYVEPDKREALYAGATLLVIPSLDEGFGIPALEAMAAGVPVVAARRGALPEVLGDAGVLVNPLDPDDVAAGLRQVYDDAGCAARCVERGLARVGCYRWTDAARSVYDAYRAAVARYLQERRA
jgi:glycosyltransferase involved in cell wall biosynthesis